MPLFYYMKIIKNDIKNTGNVTLSATCKDDIYRLSKICSTKDLLETKTSRKLIRDNGKSQYRITCTLGISVESLDVDLEMGILYAKGKIVKTVDRIPMGAYHTLSIGSDQLFSLTKNEWSQENIKLLKSGGCGGDKNNSVCFIIFYDRDCVISSYNHGNIKPIAKFEAKPKNFEAIFKAVFNKQKNVVITGVTELCNTFCSSYGKQLKCISCFKLPLDYKGKPNMKVIQRIYEDKNYSSKLNLEKNNEEFIEFFKIFQKGSDMIILGWKEISEALEFNAVETIFMTSDVYRPNDAKKRAIVEVFLKKLKEKEVSPVIITGSSVDGEKLKSIGGIGGKLRYKYK